MLRGAVVLFARSMLQGQCCKEYTVFAGESYKAQVVTGKVMLQGAFFKVQCTYCMEQVQSCMLQGACCKVHVARCMLQGARFKVHVARHMMQGACCKVHRRQVPVGRCNHGPVG